MSTAGEVLPRVNDQGRGRVAIQVEDHLVLSSKYCSLASLARLSKLAGFQERP